MPTVGSYAIWTADANGGVLNGPDPNDPAKNPFPVPSDPVAVDIYFGIDFRRPA
jgi:hypothetical protein